MIFSYFGLILTVFVILLGSAFFSAAETALTVASRARMHMLEKEGNYRAKIVNKMRSRADLLLGTILLGGTLMNSLSSSLITSVFTPIFGEAGIIYATALATALLVIFGEITPKSYAINSPDRISLVMAPSVHFLMMLFKPVLLVIEWISNAILSLFGIKHHANIGYSLGDEELRGAIDLHHDPEIGTQGKRAMLRSILDLKDVMLEAIMIHRTNVFMLDVDLPEDEIIEKTLNCQFTRIPVWKSNPDNIVGVLHVKNLLRAIRANKGTKIKIMELVQKPWFVPETTSLFEQLQAFRERHEHFAVIVDEYGTYNGIVTLEDILEEIVGDITDEYDIATMSFNQDADGSYTIPGYATIRDINREFEWDLPDDDAATLAGLLMLESREIPDVGQVLMYFGFKFEITRKQKNQITLVKVTKLGDGVNGA